MTLLEKLIICHFVGDWLFQNQYIADRKTKDHAIRAMHCVIYSVERESPIRSSVGMNCRN
jgi:hypothetical protein